MPYLEREAFAGSAVGQGGQVVEAKEGVGKGGLAWGRGIGRKVISADVGGSNAAISKGPRA